ncbi:MAG: hypothetical protein LAO06_03640 [Acidobacteriia bacterium]|nr:hypothetical protein [Terriglobia bacterium]
MTGRLWRLAVRLCDRGASVTFASFLAGFALVEVADVRANDGWQTIIASKANTNILN